MLALLVPNNVAATKVSELKLSSVSLETMADHSRLATALAQRLVKALPGSKPTTE